MSEMQHDGAEDGSEIIPVAGDDFDPETGEMREGGGVDLEEIAAATSKILKRRPMTPAEIAAATKGREPIPCGIMGWFAKVGAQPPKKKGGATIPGARLKGQIVGALTTPGGKYGPQQAIIVFGRYQCPEHIKNRVRVKAMDKVGRFMVGIDATLTELPGHVGDILDLEMRQTGGPGTQFPRHEYERVDIWSVDGFQPSEE